MREQYCALNGLFFDKSYPKGALIEKYTAFINLNPKYYAAYRDRAILYTHIGKYREAVADNQLLIRIMKEYGRMLLSIRRKHCFS